MLGPRGERQVVSWRRCRTRNPSTRPGTTTSNDPLRVRSPRSQEKPWYYTRKCTLCDLNVVIAYYAACSEILKRVYRHTMMLASTRCLVCR
jgi:hypothetical protein